MSTTGRLRELIRAVRSCKTAAEERSLVQKECASIRQAFKENRESTRSANMLKLLYITMLGYPTEFGQMEVVKLIAQADYGGKRIGYLTLAVVLDETHEVLTLAENHIKKDLSNSNSFVQALALDVVANVSGEDMSRDVLHEVEQLIDSSNIYLKKKACLAALRIVKKVPDYAEIFLEKLTNVFSEKNQAALMCSLTLVNLCLQTEQGQTFLQAYRQQITAAVRVLKQLVLATKVCDQDIGGISDPFLQVKLLQFLRICGRGSAVASEAMNDVLAQVATNTDSSKNVGSAIHYECVKTINAIEAEDGLRVLGINTIGRFLTSTRDNNVRFVALATLLTLVKSDVASVQRHHATIIDCLKDPDPSIRRRALELTVALIDVSSVRILVPDLLQYLQACSADMQSEVAEQIASVIENKSPSAEWRVEISLRLFRIAKQHVPVSFATSFIALVTQQNAELQKLAVKGLWEEVCGPLDASLQPCQSLLTAAVWCLGEFGEALTDVSGDDIASSIATIAMNTSFSAVKQYSLTALMKLATKMGDAVRPIANSVFDCFASNLDCELQQRACEYNCMLEAFSEIARFSFSSMPPIVPCDDEVAPPTLRATESVSQPAATTPVPAAPKPSAIDDLFGPLPVAAPAAAPKTLSDDLFGPAPVVAPAAAPAPKPSPQTLLDDLWGPKPTPPAQAPVTTSTVDIFGPPVTSSPAPVAAPPPPPPKIPSYQCSDFEVAFTARYSAPSTLFVEATLKANIRIQQVAFHIAVPRTSTVEVLPLAANEVAAGSSIVQKLTVVSQDPSKARQLLLRVKLVYASNGALREQLFQVSHEVA